MMFAIRCISCTWLFITFSFSGYILIHKIHMQCSLQTCFYIYIKNKNIIFVYYIHTHTHLLSAPPSHRQGIVWRQQQNFPLGSSAGLSSWPPSDHVVSRSQLCHFLSPYVCSGRLPSAPLWSAQEQGLRVEKERKRWIIGSKVSGSLISGFVL